MKNILKVLIAGMVQGIGIGIVLFLAMVLMENYTASRTNKEPRESFKVSSVDFTDPKLHQISGNQITVRLVLENPEKKYIPYLHFDAEFFDSSGKFLFGYNEGMDGTLYPKAEDNISFEVDLPVTIEFSDIEEVRVVAYGFDI